MVRNAIAWDMDSSELITAHKLISYSNIWTDAFGSSRDGFQKYSRASSPSIPHVLRDDSLSGSDSYGIVDENDYGEFFGIADTVNSDTGNDGEPINATWQFDINGETNLQLRVDVAAIGNFEGPDDSSPMDFFKFTASVDGGDVQELIATETDKSVDMTYTLADGSTVEYGDPLKIGNLYLTNNFQTVTALIDGTGSILTITLEAVANGSSEAMAFRNLFVFAEDFGLCN